MTFLKHGQKGGATSGLKITASDIAHQGHMTKQNSNDALNQLNAVVPTQRKKLMMTKFETQNLLSGLNTITNSEGLGATSRDEEEAHKNFHNFGQEHSQYDSQSFADAAKENQKKRGLTTQKSGITLLSSHTQETYRRVAKRYQREHKIAIFEDGTEICAATPCVIVELNSLLLKYYVRQNGASEVYTKQEDIAMQIKMYERAVEEILD